MRWGTFAVGLVVGALLLGAVRFTFLPPPPSVHFHANFALFVDGQRVALSDDRYMEDVAACAAGDVVRPQDRAHMHNHDQDVVHVHHGGATWGHFFANLGMGLGDRYLILDDGRRFFDGEEGRTLEFFVNGNQVAELQNRPLRSEDRVLISMGPESPEQVLATQVPLVASTAAVLNGQADPATCTGSMHQLTVRERLRRAFWDL